MLQRKLRVLLAFSYYLLLIFGLMPTTLSVKSKRLHISKPSKLYLIYSFCLTVVVLLQFLFTFEKGIIAAYMRDNIVLQWNLILNFALRLAAFTSWYSLVWLQRSRLERLSLNFLHNWRQHWQILARVAGVRSMEGLQQQLAGVFWRLLWVQAATLLCSLLIQYQLLTQGELSQFLVKAFQMLIFIATRTGFCALLLLLNHQFEAVLLSLQALQRRRSCQSQADLCLITAIHAKWLKLSRKAFGVYDLAIATLLINMFATNVNILYHAVQYGNRSIKSNIAGFIIGDGLVFFNTLNTVLVMNLIDQTINACNNAGYVLKGFNDLRRISTESKMELELFMNRLQTNRLVYRICGCVALDRPAFLGYMASVLNNVLILMQFDLKREGYTSQWTTSLVSDNSKQS